MDPVLELQTAIIERLRAVAGVTDLVAQRSYDEPPQNQNGTIKAKLPYISLGPSSFVPVLIDCIKGGEISLQIDAWSDAPGQPEVRRLADAIASALTDQDLVLTDNALVTFEHLRTDFLSDGTIKHASVRFAATVEEPS